MQSQVCAILNSYSMSGSFVTRFQTPFAQNALAGSPCPCGVRHSVRPSVVPTCLLCMTISILTVVLRNGAGSTSCELDGERFGFGACAVLPQSSALPMAQKQSQTICKHGVWPWAATVLFTKPGGGPDVAHGPPCADPRESDVSLHIFKTKTMGFKNTKKSVQFHAGAAAATGSCNPSAVFHQVPALHASWATSVHGARPLATGFCNKDLRTPH